jgi:hypothetical protein
MKHSIIFLTSLLVTSASTTNANASEINAAPANYNKQIAQAVGFAVKASLVLLPVAIEPSYIRTSFAVGALTGLIKPTTNLEQSV